MVMVVDGFQPHLDVSTKYPPTCPNHERAESLPPDAFQKKTPNGRNVDAQRTSDLADAEVLPVWRQVDELLHDFLLAGAVFPSSLGPNIDSIF
jgi:hypothetical protein